MSATDPTQPTWERPPRPVGKFAVGLAGVAAVVLLVLFVIVPLFRAPSAEQAAIDFVKAVAQGNGSQVASSAVVVGSDGPVAASVIRQELSHNGNRLATSDVTVLRTVTTGSQTEVEVKYGQRTSFPSGWYDLTKDSHGAGIDGWTVHLSAIQLSVRADGYSGAAVDGLPVQLQGGSGTIDLFPANVVVTAPSTAYLAAQQQSVDLRSNCGLDGCVPTASAHLTAELAPDVREGATAAMVAQLKACIASKALTTANCPNTDLNASSAGVYTQIAWSPSSDPTKGLTLALQPDGSLHATGSLAASVSYVDSTPDFLGNPTNSPASDGPYTWQYDYKLSENGGHWVPTLVSSSNGYF